MPHGRPRVLAKELSVEGQRKEPGESSKGKEKAGYF
jgi:hypothetical protein